MPLKDVSLRAALPRERPYKLFDGRGLFLLVTPKGQKYWRIRYKWHGREKLLSPGPYPDVTLAKARDAREDARRLLRDGVDPSVRKKRRGVPDKTLRAVATRWHDDRKAEWTSDFGRDVWRSLELHIFPVLGDRDITTVTPLDLLSALKPLTAQGKRKETVRRLRQRLSEIFRLAVLEGLRPDDPAAVLVDALPATRATPMRAIREDQVGGFLAAVDRAGNPLVAAAIRVQLLTATRPGEVRDAKWPEFDLDEATWAIPAERMKRRREHVIPLSHQSVNELRSLRRMTGHRERLFPHRLDPSRAFSNNTVNALIARVGFGGLLTAHGLRSLFSTVCNERRFAEPDVIEHALAHVERSRTKRVYDRGDRFLARRPLMQRWADHIDALCDASVQGRSSDDAAP